MTFAVVLEIIQGLLRFPGEILSLIRILGGVPAEKRQGLLKSIQEEALALQKDGRPTWDD